MPVQFRMLEALTCVFHFGILYSVQTLKRIILFFYYYSHKQTMQSPLLLYLITCPKVVSRYWRRVSINISISILMLKFKNLP